MRTGGPAERRWAQLLAAWAIPREILDRAPEPPWGFSPALFAAPDQPQDGPSRQKAMDALGGSGSVLDVGAGGGAAGLALVPPASELTAVDESPAMLAALEATAAARGLAVRTVPGRWPEVAETVGEADVVVCHHVLYNVADLGDFVVALSDHARRRVVVEITARHPLAGTNGLWRHFHGHDRPEGPTFEDALGVLAEVGIDAGVEVFPRPSRWEGRDRAMRVAFVRRRLCLDSGRDPEIDSRLEPGVSDLEPTEAACLWWDT